MRCFFCSFINKNKTEKCQTCNYYLNSKEIKEGLHYLNSGFSKINDEINDLENKTYLVIGIIFKRHKYNSDDLIQSSSMNRIKSIVGKIKDDVERWQKQGKFPDYLINLYDQYSEETQTRLRNLNHMIQEMKPTLWEKIGNFFRKLYKIVTEFLPAFGQRLIIGRKHRLIEAID